MRGAKAFVDTNILLYLFSDDKTKKGKALSSLNDNTCLISVQVAMEFCGVYTKKFHHTPEEARVSLERISKRCTMRPVTSATIGRALDVQARYGYSFYDSVMIASAIEHRCQYLFSEDMKHKQTIEGSMIFNIFAA